MAKIKKLKIKQPDGSFSQPIPLGADAANVDIDGKDLPTYLIKMEEKIQTQISKIPVIYSGTTPPDNSKGQDGDIYIQYEL